MSVEQSPLSTNTNQEANQVIKEGIEPKEDRLKESEILKNLSFQERILAHAMLYENKDALIDYQTDQLGHRINANFIKTEDEWIQLCEKFRKDPTLCQAIAIQSLRRIIEDPKLGEEEKRTFIQIFRCLY